MRWSGTGSCRGGRPGSRDGTAPLSARAGTPCRTGLAAGGFAVVAGLGGAAGRPSMRGRGPDRSRPLRAGCAGRLRRAWTAHPQPRTPGLPTRRTRRRASRGDTVETERSNIRQASRILNTIRRRPPAADVKAVRSPGSVARSATLGSNPAGHVKQRRHWSQRVSIICTQAAARLPGGASARRYEKSEEKGYLAPWQGQSQAGYLEAGVGDRCNR